MKYYNMSVIIKILGPSYTPKLRYDKMHKFYFEFPI